MIYILLEGNDKYKLIETTLKHMRQERWTEFSYEPTSSFDSLSIGERFAFIAANSSYTEQRLPKADGIIYCNAKPERKIDLEDKRDKTHCVAIELNSGDHDLRFYILNFYAPKRVHHIENAQQEVKDTLFLQNHSTNSHSEIYNTLTKLGYKSPFLGFCNGVSMRWLEAFFLEEEAIFDDKIKKIMSQGNEYINEILTLRETNELNVKKGIKALSYPTHLLDLLGFYESMQLYQNPFSYLSLFDEPVWQGSVNKIASIASSDQIYSLGGGLVEIYSNPGIYTKTELKIYLDNLAEVIECYALVIDASERVGMILRNHEHTVALAYTTGKGWDFMDINKYPSFSFQVKETDLLAEQIATGFQVKDSYIAFNTSIITVSRNLHRFALKNLLNQFTKNNPLTKEVACRVSNSNNLAIIAAQHGHVEILMELATYGVNLDMDIDGTTPAHAAAINGHVIVLQVLIPFINVDKKGKFGQTLLYIAAQQGYEDVVSLLLAHGANPNQTIHHNHSPVFIAALLGHINVIKALITSKADLNLPSIASAEEWRVFASSHNKEVVNNMEQFIERQLNSGSATNSIAISAYDISLIMGYKEIAQLLSPESLIVSDKMSSFFFGNTVNDTQHLDYRHSYVQH